MAFKELSECVEIEYDKLNVNKNGQIAQYMDTTIQESTSLMQQAPNDKPIIIIQIQTDNIVVSPVTSTFRIHFPIAITIISLLQIVLYVYDSMGRQNGSYSQSAEILLFRKADRQQVWRFLTYMFVHQDKFHLGLNIFLQFLGGVPLEISQGWLRVTIVYLAGVLGGSLGVGVFNSETLVGASAGVYSILGAHISTLILNWKETEDRVVRIFILLVYIITNLFTWMRGSPTSILLSKLNDTTIAHFCGFIVGTLIAIIILKNTNVRAWERKIQIISLLVLVFLISLEICLITFIPEFNIKNLIPNGTETQLKPS